MAKTYVNAVKYNIRQHFKIKGIVDKPDIVGAVFGQSEGLVGEDLDLRELQKNGKIGRIEIDYKSSMGQTRGTLVIPSSLDMVQTSLLAAAIESIDKVGPCEAKFETTQIEDNRTQKRQVITERAKELLKKFQAEEIPESSALAEQIRGITRKAEIIEFGREKLPAGPDVEKEDKIILVEGRADVLNLLKHGIGNAIGFGGTNVAQTAVDLCKKKKCVVFVDGDRGGDLNARKLQQITKIEGVVKAPDGKEVEDLEGKEIFSALRKEREFIPFARETKEFEKPFQRGSRYSGSREYSSGRDSGRSYSSGNQGRGYSSGRERSYSGSGRGSYGDSGRSPYSGSGRSTSSRSFSGRSGYPQRRDSRGSRDSYRGNGRGYPSRGAYPGREGFSQRETTSSPPKTIQVSAEDKAQFEPIIKELKGSLEAILFDGSGKEIKRVKVRNLLKDLEGIKGVHSIVFDGIITKRLLEEAKKHGVKALVGVKIGRISEDEKDVKLIEIRA